MSTRSFSSEPSRRCFMAAFAVVVASLAGAALAEDPGGGAGWKDLPLADALDRLRADGLVIVFTSRTVGPEMIVAAEPSSSDPAVILAEILAPHGLEALEGSPGVFVIVAAGRGHRLTGVVQTTTGSAIPGAEARLVGLTARTTTRRDGQFRIDDVPPGEQTVEIRAFGFVTARKTFSTVDDDVNLGIVSLAFAPSIHEEIVVQPSQVRLLETEPTAPISLTREEIDRLPHLGGDFLRTISLLPGTAANDITAQFNIHGGRTDEVQVVLDGQEIYEAFHLKDYDNALSIIADENLGLAKLSTGAFPASYGDRMSGVLDLTTVSPSTPVVTRLTASVTSVSALSSGRLTSRRGGWLLSGRTSSPIIPSDVIGNAEPSFWDGFAKLEYDLTPRQTLTARLLGAGDRLTEEEQTETGIKDFDTEYNSLYAWVIHQAIAGSRSLARTTLSWSSIDRDRRGFENDDTVTFEVRDLRDLEVGALAQTWDVQVDAFHVLRFGGDVRLFEAGYDYFSSLEETGEIERSAVPLEADTFVFADRFDGDHYGLWVSDRFTPVDPLTLELGLRFDKHSLTDDSLTSPRLNAAWRLAEGTVLRAAWGIFHQTQRPYELQVEDRETRFFEPEKSEHRVLGFEKTFHGAGPIRAVRLEAYGRRISNPRQRFENLVEPINTFPEIEPDRVLIVPDKGRADGVELLVRGVAGPRVDWGFMYAWARSEDLVEGMWRPRPTDQRHTVNSDVNVRLTQRWNLNIAWRYHSGWPTTAILAERNEDGDYELVFGPYNGERLPAWHRMDMRLAREWPTRRGRVTLYLDVQNLYDRQNEAGFDPAVDPDSGDIEIETEYWPGILPSLGISWQF